MRVSATPPLARDKHRNVHAHLVRQRIRSRLRVALRVGLRGGGSRLALGADALGACALCAKHTPRWLSACLHSACSDAQPAHAPLHMLWYAALMVNLAHWLLSGEVTSAAAEKQH